MVYAYEFWINAYEESEYKPDWLRDVEWAWKDYGSNETCSLCVAMDKYGLYLLYPECSECPLREYEVYT